MIAGLVKYLYSKIYRYLHAYKSNQVKIGNYKMFVPKNSLWCFEGGDYYERNVIYWLDKIFDKLEQPIMYNVGANYGYYIIRFADRCKLCCAFEPVGSVYSILEQNIRSNSLKNVRLIRKGVSNQVGDSIIYTYSSDLNSSLFQRTIPMEHTLKTKGFEKIELDSIDNMVSKSSLPPPDLMIIDVEGAELDVLKGAKNTIRRFKPIIIFEYADSTSKDANYDKEDLLTFLKQFGYVFWGLMEDQKILDIVSETEIQSNSIANV